MRTCAPILLCAVLLASCMTAATRRDIDAKASLVQAVEATPPTFERDATLIALRLELDTLKAKGMAEQRADWAKKAEIVETTAAAASPLAGMFFPPAMIALGLIGAIAGVVKSKFSKPEEV